MGEAAPPPSYAIAPVELLYQMDLPPSVLVTGLRIFGLGWNHNYEYTDAVGLDRLCSICSLSRRQFFAHLRLLVNRRVLRYTYPRATGLYVFDLTTIRRGARAGPGEFSAEIRTDPILSCCCCSDPREEGEFTLQQQEQQQQVVSGLGGGVGGGGAECGNPHWAERVEVLARMGVLEPTRSELAGLDWATVEYLEGWERWIQEHEEVGVGLVVQQIRAGEGAPSSRMDRRLRATESDRWRYAEWGGRT